MAYLMSTRKDMAHSVISIDSILLNSMRNGKKCDFSWAKKMGITSMDNLKTSYKLFHIVSFITFF